MYADQKLIWYNIALFEEAPRNEQFLHQEIGIHQNFIFFLFVVSIVRDKCY